MTDVFSDGQRRRQRKREDEMNNDNECAVVESRSKDSLSCDRVENDRLTHNHIVNKRLTDNRVVNDDLADSRAVNDGLIDSCPSDKTSAGNRIEDELYMVYLPPINMNDVMIPQSASQRLWAERTSLLGFNNARVYKTEKLRLLPKCVRF